MTPITSYHAVTGTVDGVIKSGIVADPTTIEGRTAGAAIRQGQPLAISGHGKIVGMVQSGPSTSSDCNVFIQPDAPVTELAQYVWYETYPVGHPNAGELQTIWVYG